MMTTPGSMQLLVRTLKGAPLSCLMVLILAEGPLEVGRLCMMTGYSSHPVTEALKMLAEIGQAQSGKQRSNWQITPYARQIFAALSMTEEAPQAPEIRENRDSESTASTAAVKFKLLYLLTAAVEAAKTALSEMGFGVPGEDPFPGRFDQHAQPTGKRGKRPRKMRSRQSPTCPADQSGLPGESSVQAPADILKALHQAGIFEPTATELALRPHVTLQYVQAHAAKTRREKIDTGLLIHRIRSQDPLPTDPDNRNFYISGEYAEFVKH